MKEQHIVDWILDRLRLVTVANGYQTDAGQNVGLGRPLRDTGAHYVVAGEEAEAEEQQGTRVRSVMEINVEGYADADPDNPAVEGRKVLADAERAIFSGITDPRTPIKAIGASIAWVGNSIDYRDDGSRVEVCAVTVQARFTKDLTNP